jgi:S1-C subfamily serine protease
MNKLLKLLATFLLSLSVIFMISPLKDTSNLDNNIIRYDYTDTQQAELVSNMPNRRAIMEPVVKLTQISFPEPETIELVGTATGFSIKYNRRLNKSYVLTNHHFCENNTEYDIGYIYTRSNNTTGGYSIDLNNLLNFVYSDKTKDLCILEADGRIPPVRFGDYREELKSLDRVYILGAPNGIFPIVVETYLTGHIERKQLFSEEMGDKGHPYLLISEIIFGGHSGSPIFNRRGELIGIVFAKYRQGYGGFGVGLKDIIEFIGESDI